MSKCMFLLTIFLSPFFIMKEIPTVYFTLILAYEIPSKTLNIIKNPSN